MLGKNPIAWTNSIAQARTHRYINFTNDIKLCINKIFSSVYTEFFIAATILTPFISFY